MLRNRLSRPLRSPLEGPFDSHVDSHGGESRPHALLLASGPTDVPVAEAPAWLRALLDGPRHDASRPAGRLSPSRAVALVAGLYRVVVEAAEGERNASR